MTTLLLSIFYAFGTIVFVLGLQAIAFVPLNFLYESWKRRFLSNARAFDGFVSVIIPAYNEQTTIRSSVLSVLASDYARMEVIVVNDGSTDATAKEISDLADTGRIKYISKSNGGKASALNAGIAAAKGEVVVFTDADSFFLADTIRKTVRWFADPSIDAVCGNDAPLNPSTPVQKFLAITTHIGTGFVRRALSVLRSLPIITGNLGAIRMRALKEIGGFKEVWGEDLEITFRLYKNRSRIVFDPEPRVLAECPSSVSALWRQRIRWMRSYLKITFMHKDIFFNPRFAPFSYYLPVNFVNMALIPILQVVLLALIPWAFYNEHLYFTDTIEVLSFFGIWFFVFVAVFSILMDRAYRDLRYLPYGLLILPFSYFYNAVTAYSWFKQITSGEETWVKIERERVSGANLSWAIGLILVILSSGATYYYMAYIRNAPAEFTPAFELALSTHFDAWPDWRKATSNILKKPDVSGASVIGVSAGRGEWTYFKWNGHEDAWSNHQFGAREDMLLGATNDFHRRNFKVAAFIDVYAPKYIEEHPGTGAIGFDGKANTEQLSLIELVEGAYGDRLVEMIDYVAANYPVDIVDVTEMPYYSYSFNKKELKSFKALTGRRDWPRLKNGYVDRDNHAVWKWKNALMEGYMARLAGAAHRNGKKIYIDVPVSWKDLNRNGAESGLDYKMVLKHADAIVIWNYYHLEGLDPSFSEKLASYVVANFPAEKVYVSIGLWGKKEPMSPGDLDAGIASTLKGGVKKIWITPDSLVTKEHWDAIVKNLKK